MEEEVCERIFAEEFCQCTYTLTPCSGGARLCECSSCPNKAPQEPGMLEFTSLCHAALPTPLEHKSPALTLDFRG